MMEERQYENSLRYEDREAPKQSKCVKPIVLVSISVSFAIALQVSSPSPDKSRQVEQDKTAAKKTESPKNQQSAHQPTAPLVEKRSVVAARDQHRASAKDGDKTAQEYWSKLNASLVTAFTGVLAVLAVLQWLSMRKQAKYMRDGLALNRDTLVAAHPPKLIVRNLTLKPIPKDSDDWIKTPMSGHFYVENRGRTKAKITRACSMVMQLGIDLPAESPYEGKVGSTYDIEVRPGVSVQLEFPLEASDVSWADREIGQHLLIHVIGWIEYIDDSGDTRRSKFWRFEEGRSMRFRPVKDTEYENATEE